MGDAYLWWQSDRHHGYLYATEGHADCIKFNFLLRYGPRNSKHDCVKPGRSVLILHWADGFLPGCRRTQYCPFQWPSWRDGSTWVSFGLALAFRNLQRHRQWETLERLGGHGSLWLWYAGLVDWWQRRWFPKCSNQWWKRRKLSFRGQDVSQMPQPCPLHRRARAKPEKQLKLISNKLIY